MICSGIDALSGAAVEVSGNGAIAAVSPAARPGRYIAPGWIDLQVNGFAGVDYNTPDGAAWRRSRAPSACSIRPASRASTPP